MDGAGRPAGATFKRQDDEIDDSSKTSQGWKDTIPGLRSWGIKADALVLDDDAAFEKLDECYFWYGYYKLNQIKLVTVK